MPNIGRVEGVLALRDQLTGTMRRAQSQVSRSTGKMRSSMDHLGSTIAAVFSGVVIARGVRMAVDAIKEEEAAVRGLESRLKGLGPAALEASPAFQKMASDLQKATGRGNEEILRMQTKLLTFRHIGPEIFGELSETVLDVAEVMEGGLKGATLQLGKALEDPARRVSELSRAGITFTNAQQDMIRAMQESGDLLGAQKLVLAEVRAQYAGAARDARDTLAGAMRAASAAWGDFLEVVMQESGGQGAFRTAIESFITAINWLADNWGAFESAFHMTMDAIVGSTVEGVAEILDQFAVWAEGLSRIAQAIPLYPQTLKDRAAESAQILRSMADDVTLFSESLHETFQEKAEAALKRFEVGTISAAGTIRGFGADVEQLGDEAEETMKKLQDMVKAAAERMKVRESTERIREEYIDRLVDGLDDIKELPITLADTVGPEAAEILQNATESAAEAAAPSFGQTIGDAVATAIGQALASGDVKGAVQGLGNALASAASTAIAESVGGVQGAILGAGVGGLISGLVGSLFGGGGGPPPFQQIDLGTTRVFQNASTTLLDGANRLGDAAASMLEFARGLRTTLSEIETILGGALLSNPEFNLTQTAEDEFLAVLTQGGQTIAAGFGSSAGEAMQAALDSFARNFRKIIDGFVEEVGKFDISDTSGVDQLPLRILRETPGLGLDQLISPQFVAALREMQFISWDDLVSSIRLWSDALNSVTTTLGAFSPATDSAFQKLALMRMEIERSGLSAATAAPFLAQLAESTRLLMEQRTASFLQDIAGIMERAGVSAAKVAAFRAIAEQKIVQLKLIELEITAKNLGLWNSAWASLFANLTAWAGNVMNFVQATARIAAPTIRSAGSISQASSRLQDERERLGDFLQSLDFTAPGTPQPGKSGIDAALEAAARAAQQGDVSAFMEASQSALTIAERFGSPMLELVREQVRALGDFEPVVEQDPVVGAIGDLGSSIGVNFADITAAINEFFNNSDIYITESIGADLLELADRNEDGRVRLREALRAGFSEDLFELLDVNNSGFLDLEELSSEHARLLIHLIDVNQDGILQLEELGADNDAILERLLAIIDLDQDGQLTQQEVLNATQGQRDLLFQLLDINRDGFLDIEELENRGLGHLASLLNTNRDGFRDVEEITRQTIPTGEPLTQRAMRGLLVEHREFQRRNNARNLERSNRNIQLAVDNVRGEVRHQGNRTVSAILVD